MDLEALSRGIAGGIIERPRVAVDAMGGDTGPEVVVRGALDWARDHPDNAEIQRWQKEIAEAPR